MSTQVDTTPEFEKEVERLARKYPAVLDEVDRLVAQLETNARPGNRMTRAGGSIYKVRLANRSARRGKSGGLRVVYAAQSLQLVVLVTIYSKTEKDDINNDDIGRIMAEMNK